MDSGDCSMRSKFYLNKCICGLQIGNFNQSKYSVTAVGLDRNGGGLDILMFCQMTNVKCNNIINILIEDNPIRISHCKYHFLFDALYFRLKYTQQTSTQLKQEMNCEY